MTTVASTTALTKRATVPCTRERAFELFTREMSAWWPLATHSVGADSSCHVHVQERVGGHIVETLPDGTTAIWGSVEVWEPPGRVAFSWHPGNEAARATRVDVTFDESATGPGTLVTLIHRGWSVRSDGAVARRAYDSGWDHVLGGYYRQATSASPEPPGQPRHPRQTLST